MEKRRSFAFLTIMVLLMLTACVKQSQYPADDTYHFETDFQYTWCHQGMDREFAESEDGYYFQAIVNNRTYLIYIDKQTMQAIPLCGKPNCLHYEETDEERIQLCNALLNDYGAMFYSDGTLYAVTSSEEAQEHKALYAFAKDGSSRKELFKIPQAFSDCLAVHRGNLYVGLNTYSEEVSNQVSILSYDLNHPAKEPETIYQQDFTDATHIMDIVCYGNHLYFHIIEASASEPFYEVNLQSHKVQEVFPYGDKEGEYYHYKTVIWNNQLITEETRFYDAGRGEREGAVLLADLDGGNVKRGMNIWAGPYTADERYLYRWTMFSGGGPLSDQPTFQVYDQNEKLVAQLDLTKELTDYRKFYVSPGEHIFVLGRSKLYYFTKTEIASGSISPKLLWEHDNMYMRY